MCATAAVASDQSITLAELCRRALGTAGFARRPVAGVTDDSRAVRPGWVFVAVRGGKADGHDFVPEAVANGAVAVVSERAAGVPPGVTELIVPDARQALARLMAGWTGLDRIQQEGRLRVFGITGTNGKTTTTYLVQAILRAAGHATARLGTTGLDLVHREIAADGMTTPPAVVLCRHLVEAAEAGARFAALEVTSHALDQRRVDGIDFEAAAFTNLTPEHLDYHGTMANYRRAKKRLFELLRPGATALVNVDDPGGELIADGTRARVVRYGFADRADLRIEIVQTGAEGSRFRLHHPGVAGEYATPLAGRHNLYNAAAAFGAARALGVDVETIRTALAAAGRVPGRLERVTGEGEEFHVYVDYAHTEDALRNVLAAVRPFTRGRLCCVFGCGGDRDRTKRPRMGTAAAELADRVFVTSDNPRGEEPERIIDEVMAGIPADARARTERVVDRAEAIGRAIEDAAEGDTVLIAGKGHEDYQIIGATRRHFSDAEAAAEALRRRARRGGRPGILPAPTGQP